MVRLYRSLDVQLDEDKSSNLQVSYLYSSIALSIAPLERVLMTHSTVMIHSYSGGSLSSNITTTYIVIVSAR